MSFMIEVYYRAPADELHERRVSACAGSHGGRLDYRELPDSATGPVCLTFEFDVLGQADAAADCLRGGGEHVEGPSRYGD